VTGLAAGAPWLPTRELIATKHLELRKRRGLMVAVAVLTLAPPVLILGVRLLAHLVDPSTYGPAGRLSLFSPITGLMAEFGFIVAAAVGASAGSTDLTDGFFRQLVVTGRSRLALYLARIPAGLAIVLPPVALGFAVLCLVTGYASGPQPASLAVGEMIKVGLWLELEVAIGFLVGLGLGSLMGQRTIPTILLIVLEIIITPALAGHAIPYLLDGQRLIVGVAMDQLRPAALAAGPVGGGPLSGGGRLQIPPMPTWAMITVIAGWLVGWSVVGAWRMMTRDA
jgi:ABC-type transport system involved in cytochrome c biogenesis permease component